MFDQAFYAAQARRASKDFRFRSNRRRRVAPISNLEGKHSTKQRHLVPGNFISRMGTQSGIMHALDLSMLDEKFRHLSIHRGHSLDISNGHDALVDVSAAKQMTFTGTREELRERLVQLEARGATGIIFGTSGYDVERELRAYAEVAGLR